MKCKHCDGDGYVHVCDNLYSPCTECDGGQVPAQPTGGADSTATVEALALYQIELHPDVAVVRIKLAT